jgi:hypothetical protein
MTALRVGFARWLVVTTVLAAAACGKDEQSPPLDSDPGTGGSQTQEPPGFESGIYRVEGRAQKGPFTNGTSIEVRELNDTLVPTGRSFAAETTDDGGQFELPGVTLESRYVRLSADGFYFNEVRGAVSDSRLELTALADVTDTASINANVLSHIERPRVEYLIGTGVDFHEAKRQAQGEVLAIFGIDAEGVGASETLDIARGTVGDAALLAVSLILQGTNTVGEMSELLSNISTDLRTDGALNSASTGTALMNEAMVANLPSVRENLVQRYERLGITANVGDFESHVRQFTETSSFEFTKRIEYPEQGEYGPNLLAVAAADMPSGEYSLRAILPKGTSLRVVLTLHTNQPWFINAFQDGQWEVVTPATDARAASFVQEFIANEADADMSVSFNHAAGSATMDVYENGAAEPTRSTPFGWLAP